MPSTSTIAAWLAALVLDFEKLRQTPSNLTPFPHLVADKLLCDNSLEEIRKSFPDVPGAGSFPAESLQLDSAFADLLAELQSAQLAEILEEKLQVPLSGFPTMITVRGHCRKTDGKIHADSSEKLATLLLYLNPDWQRKDGCLQLLNAPDSLASSFMEIPPEGGTMLAFRCDSNAWHGHPGYAGPRRALQLNWVSSHAWLRRERFRHQLSATAKKIRRWLAPEKKPTPIPTS